ncbi:hypothetical protein EYF80_004648 [Liparis tanakae]|uniref:Uncharacterized protein n=1 Tax=Liparis tanakae TaxID=230148 RepID=A0A4Z2J527_9TELE|nr:hypothetical protein EYF80_004648 [Liparis tanakae]
MLCQFPRRTRRHLIQPDVDVVVPVCARLFVVKAQSVEQLVFNHRLVVTAGPKRQNLAFLLVTNAGETPGRSSVVTSFTSVHMFLITARRSEVPCFARRSVKTPTRSGVEVDGLCLPFHVVVLGLAAGCL